MEDEVLDHVKDRNVWMRVLFMLLFGAVYYVSAMVLTALVIAQFLFVVITGRKNDRLLGFGAQLSAFFYQIITYLTYNSEERPFPFTDWPAPVMLKAAAPRPQTPAPKAAPPPEKPVSEPPAAKAAPAAKPRRTPARRKAAEQASAAKQPEAEDKA